MKEQNNNLNAKFDEVNRRFDVSDIKMSNLNAKFDEVNSRFDVSDTKTNDKFEMRNNEIKLMRGEIKQQHFNFNKQMNEIHERCENMQEQIIESVSQKFDKQNARVDDIINNFKPKK